MGISESREENVRTSKNIFVKRSRKLGEGDMPVSRSFLVMELKAVGDMVDAGENFDFSILELGRGGEMDRCSRNFEDMTVAKEEETLS